MMSVSALIDFLMKLMRDDDAKAAFDHDPQGTLDKHGLGGVSGQDVRDARLIMADDGGVRAKPGHGHSSGSGSRHDDPIREIHHTATNYVINEGTVVGGDVTVINIDDRDTTVVDSFNSHDTTNVDVTAIQDNDVTNVNIKDSSGKESKDDPAKGEPDGKEHTAGTDPVHGTSGDAPTGSNPTAGGAGSGPHSGDAGGTHDITLITDPVGTDSGGTHSVGIDPVNADPAGHGPLDSHPVDNGPVDHEPAGHGPLDSEPVDNGPVDHEPVDHGPLDSIDPVESEPVGVDAGFDAAVI